VLVVPGVHHFLSRLQELQQLATHCHSIQISDICWDDLTLMLCFLDIAKMDQHEPHCVPPTNSCLSIGLLPFWTRRLLGQRFCLACQDAKRLAFWASNNLLEYIASMISLWFDMLAGCLNRGDCALSMTDSSTSVGWLRKTNFWELLGENADPAQSRVRINTARHHATLFLKAGIKEYSWWFPGQEHNVADALLCDFDCSDSEQTKNFHESCPSQLPQHFQIIQLPNEISSWLTSLLQRLPVREQLWEAHMKPMLSHGTDSPSTLEPSASATMSSLTPSQDPNKTRSLAPLPWLSRKDGFLQQLMTPLLWEQSEIPSWIYLQLSGKTADPTQPKTMTFSLASFYNANFKPTKMPT
jgi:hypothetical protein